MKILESAPNRYDRGISILTLGRLDKSYDWLTSHIKRGQIVLDIGTGTGMLAIKAALKGSKVKGIDVNPQMLEIAQKRAAEINLTKNIELCEMSAVEIGNEKADNYNIVMSGLCFSELTEDELNYTLKEIKRILNPGGLLLIADEVVPENRLKRLSNWLIRFPLVIITYIFTQTTAKAVRDLPKKLEKTGFIIESLKLSWMEDFIEVVAKKA